MSIFNHCTVSVSSPGRSILGRMAGVTRDVVGLGSSLEWESFPVPFSGALSRVWLGFYPGSQWVFPYGWLLGISLWHSRAACPGNAPESHNLACRQVSAAYYRQDPGFDALPLSPPAFLLILGDLGTAPCRGVAGSILAVPSHPRPPRCR